MIIKCKSAVILNWWYERQYIKLKCSVLIHLSCIFFGTFAKLRQATISFLIVCLSVNPSLRQCVRPSIQPSVRLSDHTEQLDSHWTYFRHF